MWRPICVFVCIITVTKPALIDKLSIIPKILNLVENNEVNLGSYGGRVNIGNVPDITEMTDVDKNASSGARRVVELMRIMFPTGIMSVPPLDPYDNKNFEHLLITDKDSRIVTGEILVQELKVEGAKAFIINSLQIRMDTLRTDLNFTVPSLHGHVSLHLDLNIGGMLPIRLEGKVKFNIKGISVVVAVGTEEVDHEGKKIYQVKTMQGKFHADEVHLSLEGVARHLILDILSFLKKSKILENLPEVKFIMRRVNDYVAHKVKDEVNEALGGLTVAQIKAYILG